MEIGGKGEEKKGNELFVWIGKKRRVKKLENCRLYFPPNSAFRFQRFLVIHLIE